MSPGDFFALLRPRPRSRGLAVTLIEEEFSFHLESRIAEFRDAGLSPRQARIEASRRFGERECYLRECLDAGGPVEPPRKGDGFMSTLVQDLRHALRGLLRAPAFTLVALVTLALGIGANAAIFSVVNAVLLRPLPYPQPERLVVIWETEPAIEVMSVSYPNYLDWRAQSTLCESIAVFRRQNFNFTGSGEPERIGGAQVSANVFATIGVSPLLGRGFSPQDDNPASAGDTVVLSFGLWQRRFGSDPNILGAQLTLNGRPHTVIGVMPRNYLYPTRTELWVPIAPYSKNPNWQNRGNHPGIFGIARLNPGVSIQQARAEMATIAAALSKQYPDTNTGTSVVLTSMHELFVRDIRPALWILFAAVAFVLLIACANVANLQLGRASSRHREIAVRTALGAGRARIVRLLLTESLLLSLLGGALGLLLGFWGIDALLTAVPGVLPSIAVVGLDRNVFLFALALSLFTGVLFGLVPAFQASRSDLTEELKEGGRTGTAGRRGRRLKSVLVVSEVALAMVLLVGAGLLTRSFLRVAAVDPGFNPEGVLTAQIDLPAAKYSDSPSAVRFFGQLLERLATIPGVESAAIDDNPPFLGGSQTSVAISGRPLPKPGEGHLIEYSDVSPGYFQLMGISLLRGRNFTSQDQRSSHNVVIIDEKFARTFWPDGDPLGQYLMGDRQDTPAQRIEIIGIVPSVRFNGLESLPVRPQMYFPYWQASNRATNIFLRTSGDPSSLTSALRHEVLSLDPGLPVHQIQTMAQVVGDSIAGWRLNMLLTAIFSGLALVLAAVGIYGVMSYAVAQRTQEIGIRIALGAHPSSIFRLILGHGALLAGLGLALGLAAAFAVSRFLSSLLFNIAPTDAPTYAFVAALLIFIALLACYIPARRATRVDPIVALRYE